MCVTCAWCTKKNLKYGIGQMRHHAWAMVKLRAIKIKNIMRRNDTNMQFHIVRASSVFELVWVFCWCFFSSSVSFLFDVIFQRLPEASFRATSDLPCVSREFGFKLYSICFGDLLKYSFYTFLIWEVSTKWIFSYFFFHSICTFCFCMNELLCLLDYHVAHVIILLCTWSGCYFHVLSNKYNTHTTHKCQTQSRHTQNLSFCVFHLTAFQGKPKGIIESNTQYTQVLVLFVMDADYRTVFVAKAKYQFSMLVLLMLQWMRLWRAKRVQINNDMVRPRKQKQMNFWNCVSLPYHKKLQKSWNLYHQHEHNFWLNELKENDKEWWKNAEKDGERGPQKNL